MWPRNRVAQERKTLWLSRSRSCELVCMPRKVLNSCWRLHSADMSAQTTYIFTGDYVCIVGADDRALASIFRGRQGSQLLLFTRRRKGKKHHPSVIGSWSFRFTNQDLSLCLSIYLPHSLSLQQHRLLCRWICSGSVLFTLRSSLPRKGLTVFFFFLNFGAETADK